MASRQIPECVWPAAIADSGAKNVKYDRADVKDVAASKLSVAAAALTLLLIFKLQTPPELLREAKSLASSEPVMVTLIVGASEAEPTTRVVVTVTLAAPERAAHTLIGVGVPKTRQTVMHDRDP